jgi:hypothetical protein
VAQAMRLQPVAPPLVVNKFRRGCVPADGCSRLTPWDKVLYMSSGVNRKNKNPRQKCDELFGGRLSAHSVSRFGARKIHFVTILLFARRSARKRGLYLARRYPPQNGRSLATSARNAGQESPHARAIALASVSPLVLLGIVPYPGILLVCDDVLRFHK